MSRNFLKFVGIGMICSVAVLAGTVGQTIAAIKKAKEQAPVVVAKPARHQSEHKPDASIPRARKSPVAAVTERQPEANQELAKSGPAEVKKTNPKSHRRLKAHRKRVSRAAVHPRTDLMYHGMLESPQRHDFRRNHLGAGLPNPYGPELTHDHFQELDRNQDGLIDPIERAFSRLDLDRDLQTHRLR